MYLILSAVDANVTWLMGLVVVVEDDTTPLLQNYNTCTSFHFPRFSMFKIQRCRTAHTSYAHPTSTQRVHILYNNKNNSTHHIASLCHWYCSRIFSGNSTSRLFVIKITLLLSCCVGWAGRSQAHHTHTLHIDIEEGTSLTHSIIRLQPWVLATL